MFDDKQLQQLQTIHVDEAQKQKDFEKIEQRLKNKPFYWQVPAVSFSMVLLVLFLVATMPVTDQGANLSSDAYLQEVLFREGEGYPKSIYHIGVKRSADEQYLQMLQTTTQSLEPAKEPTIQKKAHRTYRLSYSDGQQLVLAEYLVGHITYFKEMVSGQYYKLDEDKTFIYIMRTKPAVWQYVLFGIIFVLLFGGNWYIDKNMRVEGDPKRKLPMHSDYTQSIAMVCYIFILFFAFMGGINGTISLHIGWLYLIGLVFAAINIAIEQKHDNNGWRKLRFINVGLLFPTYLFLFVHLL